MKAWLLAEAAMLFNWRGQRSISAASETDSGGRETDEPSELPVTQPQDGVDVGLAHQRDLQPHADGVREHAGEDDIEPGRRVAAAVRHAGPVAPDETEPWSNGGGGVHESPVEAC